MALKQDDNTIDPDSTAGMREEPDIDETRLDSLNLTDEDFEDTDRGM